MVSIWRQSLQQELPHRNNISHSHLVPLNWQYLSVCIHVFGLHSSWPFLYLRFTRTIVMAGWSSHASNRFISILLFECMQHYGGEIGAFYVPLLNLIKQWDQWGELRLELTQPYRGLFIPLQSRGPRVSMHHTQENTRQLPDSPGPSSPPRNPSLLAAYKEHITSLEPLSKSFRSHCEAPHFLPSLRREM